MRPEARYAEGKTLKYEQNSFSASKITYCLYLNGEKKGEFVMIFYDKDGNLVS